MTSSLEGPAESTKGAAALDDLTIRSLIARIAQLADTGEAGDYTRCFTCDARWEMPGDLRRGRADIQTASQARRDAGETGPGSATRHLVSTIAVEVDGNTARARSYFQFVAQTTTTPQLRLVGQYDDHFIRTDEGWLLDQRQITLG
jgi:3-phenylpropionate/cinnamic acid dioxygenase small subunit